jgi:hypothetical protein
MKHRITFFLFCFLISGFWLPASGFAACTSPAGPQARRRAFPWKTCAASGTGPVPQKRDSLLNKSRFRARDVPGDAHDHLIARARLRKLRDQFVPVVVLPKIVCGCRSISLPRTRQQ